MEENERKRPKKKGKKKKKTLTEAQNKKKATDGVGMDGNSVSNRKESVLI